MALLRRPEDPDELKRQVRTLHRRVLAGRGSAMFAPVACVALDGDLDRLRQMIHDGHPPASNDDRRMLYDIAHETAHIAQMTTSNWLFIWVKRLTWLATVTSVELQQGRPTAKWADDHRGHFRTLQAEMHTERDGYSAHQVIEAHAVIEGCRGAMPRPTAQGIVTLAGRFHRADPDYLQALDELTERLGIETAVELGPKLLGLALALPDPGAEFRPLLRALNGESAEDVALIAGLDASETVRLFGGDALQASRSPRELGAATAQGAGDLWATLMAPYLDAYESLSDGSRLAAKFHPGRPEDYARPDESPFRPRYALFADGRVLDLGRGTMDTTDFAGWVTVSLALLDALDWLARND